MTGTALFALLLLAGVARGQDEVKALEEKRFSLEHRGTLRGLVERFEKEVGAPLVVEPEVNLERPVDVRLKEVTSEAALRWIARLADGHSLRSPEGVFLLTQKGIACEAPVSRTYSTRRINREACDQPGGRLDIADANELGLRLSPFPKPEPGDSCGLVEWLTDLIKMNVEPGTWEGGRTIVRDGQGNLLVNATPAVHREIEAFLRAIEALPVPSVMVAVAIADADDARRPLLAAGVPRVVAPGELDEVLTRLRAGPVRESEVTGSGGQRVHALSTRERIGAVAVVRGDPVLKSRAADVELFDVRSEVMAGGAVRVELRLSLGETTDLVASATPPGPLPIQDRLVTRLGTTAVLPNGGGLLFTLPARDRSQPRIALLRANAPSRGAEARKPFWMTESAPDPGASRLAEKLAGAPAAGISLKDAPLSEFAAWLYRAGLDVVVDPDLLDRKVSLCAKEISPAAALATCHKAWDLEYGAVDGVLWLGRRGCFRGPLRLCILDARDVLFATPDFGIGDAEPERFCFTAEDLCNLMKNTVHQAEWEEADGKSIMTANGLIFLRNREGVIRDCIKFMDERRSPAPARVGIHAEILSVSEEAMQSVIRNRLARSFLIEATQRDTLLAQGERIERLSWISLERQRTALEWERARDYVHDAAGDRASLRACKTASSLQLRPTLEKDGKTFEVSFDYKDQLLTEVREEKTRDGFLQVPATGEVSIRTTVAIPSGETAVFRWTRPGKAGEPRRVHLLLLTPTLIP